MEPAAAVEAIQTVTLPNAVQRGERRNNRKRRRSSFSENCRRLGLLAFEQIPYWARDNPFIRTSYRVNIGKSTWEFHTTVDRYDLILYLRGDSRISVLLVCGLNIWTG